MQRETEKVNAKLRDNVKRRMAIFAALVDLGAKWVHRSMVDGVELNLAQAQARQAEAKRKHDYAMSEQNKLFRKAQQGNVGARLLRCNAFV